MPTLFEQKQNFHGVRQLISTHDLTRLKGLLSILHLAACVCKGTADHTNPAESWRFEHTHTELMEVCLIGLSYASVWGIAHFQMIAV